MTHTDPKAEHGAFLVARAAQLAAADKSSETNREEILAELRRSLRDPDDELVERLDKMEAHLSAGHSGAELAAALQLHRGVTGYMYDTVPIALYCWLRHPNDFRAAVEEAIELGGDTDTTGAIVGGLAGATVGARGIPSEWLEGLMEWPRSVHWMRELAARLAARLPDDGERLEPGPAPFFWLGLMPRNLFFLCVVLGHGFRRLLPPY